MSGRTFTPGDEIAVKHPFLWELATVEMGEDGPVDAMSWRPGVRFELLPPYGEDSEAIADGEGLMILTVISVHKPGRYPTRVFYTRRWRDPRGKEFGKGALRVKTLNAFRRIASGYQHEFRVAEKEKAA